MAEENEIEEVPKKSKSMLIIIIVVVVNVAIIAVVLVVFMGGGSESSAPVPGPASVGAPSAGPGPLVQMENFVVNIQSDEGNKYLKASLTAELANESVGSEFEKWQHIIRNEVLIYLSSLEVEETRSIKQKRTIEGHLKGLINKRVGAEIVRGIYFTEFVTQ